MSQHYFDPKREADPYALPDLEVFYANKKIRDEWDREALRGADPRVVEGGGICGSKPGWYWQACFPGCLPDGDPVGPFDSEAEALADARDGMEDENSVTLEECGSCSSYHRAYYAGDCRNDAERYADAEDYSSRNGVPVADIIVNDLEY